MAVVSSVVCRRKQFCQLIRQRSWSPYDPHTLHNEPPALPQTYYTTHLPAKEKLVENWPETSIPARSVR